MTTILDIDLGNTRLKWRVLEDATLLERGAFETDLLASPTPLPAPWSRASRVRVVAVGARAQLLSDRLAAAGIGPVEVAAAGARCGRLHSGYREPARLGADRWLALAAGAARCEGAFAVVDAGSALTLDLVDGGGRHQGGWIVPGFRLMEEALLRGTAAVRFEPLDGICAGQPGANTQEAVLGGLLTMARDFVVARTLALRAEAPAAPLYVTGGDGARLAAALTLDHERVEDLVLDGLAAVLP
ncbi:MAG: type III pantothenate kinase [Pseudomonadales bacterium]|jgi:type III pantothenate kinase|nr:type III pantothenate kinase [Pseudomonadales bacterium]